MRTASICAWASAWSAAQREVAEEIGVPVGRLVPLGAGEPIYAAGDATRFWSPLYKERIRVEHFQTAQRQGFAVGRTMAGRPVPFAEAPWFWSDQYEINLQYAGAGLAWDETVTRGTFAKPPFSVFYLRRGSMIAVAGINDHHTVARARRVMESRTPVTRELLADPAFDLPRVLG